MKNILEKIKVMQEFANGGEVEWSFKDDGDWNDGDDPVWDWVLYDYRIKEKPKHRDPTKGFEIGDLVQCKYRGIVAVHPMDITNQSALRQTCKLLEFDDPILGRLRVLQKGEPLEICGQKALIWYEGIYEATDFPNYNAKHSDEYYMPVDAYRKWKAEQEKPKTRPMTFEELIPLVGTPVRIKDGDDMNYEPLRLHIAKSGTKYYLLGDGYEHFEDEEFHENVTRLDGTPFEVEVE